LKLLKQIIKLQPINQEDNKIKLSLRIYGLGLLVLAIFTIFKMIAAKYGLYEKYDHPAGESLKNADSTLFLLFCFTVNRYYPPICRRVVI
jgi:hypothetical protein